MVIRRMAMKAFGKSVVVSQIDFDYEGKMVMKTSEVAILEDARKLEDAAHQYLDVGGIFTVETILSKFCKAEALVRPIIYLPLYSIVLLRSSSSSMVCPL